MRNDITALVFLTVFLAFISYAAAADEVSLDGPAQASIKAGTSTTINYNVINNQDTEDVFFIQTSGDCAVLTTVMTPSISVDAKSENIGQIKVSVPSSTSMSACELTITVSSQSNSNYWDEQTTAIEIQNSIQTGKTHYQSDVEPVDEEPAEEEEPSYGIEGENKIGSVGPGHLGVDIILNPKLQTRGYVLNDQGEVCVGDTIEVDDTSLKGEWYQKGGPNDSPPIQFVDDIDEVKEQIYAGTYKTETYSGTICGWKMIDNKDAGPNQCVVDTALICGYKCGMQDSGSLKELSANKYEVTGEGDVEINMECPVECLLFVDREARKYKPVMGGIVEINIDMFSTQLTRAYGILDIQSPGTLSSTTKVTAKSGNRPPELIISEATYDTSTAADQPVYARILVENQGQMEAIIDDVKLNLAGSSVVYKPDTIRAGETAEVLVKAMADDIPKLEAVIDYRSEDVGCLSQNDFSGTFQLGGLDVTPSKKCSKNEDCEGMGLISPTCCSMMCRDESSGSCDDFDGNGKFEWEYY